MGDQASLEESLGLATLWCQKKGPDWKVRAQLGTGGTAPVFELASPDGIRALKIYDAEFSSGQNGEIELKRIEQQLALCDHNCPYLVQVYEGGMFENRLYLLMSRAPGQELEKRLPDIPASKIRHIVSQVTEAAIFLKNNHLCHRDIKSANIFVTDDFEKATLLDISVIRNIKDPVGSGADRDGQLPMLATARYSPPEYLFRLLESGETLWHALTVYQLGALLHDLIMKEPIFQLEYSRSKENRYRFAWIVATEVPLVSSDMVDQDLIFIARRALDKDWKQRSSLNLEDFLADPGVQKTHSLQLLGLGQEVKARKNDIDVSKHERVREIAKILEEVISDRLRRKGATTEHTVKHGGDDNSKLLTFRWNVPTVEAEDSFTVSELRVVLSIFSRFGAYWFRSSVEISAVVNSEQRQAILSLPDVQDDQGAESTLATQIELAIPELAVTLGRAQS